MLGLLVVLFFLGIVGVFSYILLTVAVTNHVLETPPLLRQNHVGELYLTGHYHVEAQMDQGIGNRTQGSVDSVSVSRARDVILQRNFSLLFVGEDERLVAAFKEITYFFVGEGEGH